MELSGEVAKRQLWNALQPTTTKPYSHCVAYTLPSLGVISITPDFSLTLTADAVFTPQCTTALKAQATGIEAADGVSSIADMRDPFHASITPQAYATGAATVIAWMLVIMLLITPRTFFVGGATGQSGLMGRRGMIGGATGGGSIIGVGTRPWLQKVAALTVAISLTLATADTFKIAERQYNTGFTDALALRDEVVGGMEIKISRIISDIFLWLAQVQTLIRLFPRHKEKVIIKWTGFALIVLDIVFSCLNSFMGHAAGRPRHFVDAIPALSYLFQLGLSMLYAAWVIYYSITKRRYAFYHSMMWNITLVALLSFVAILTPVVFFITDISNYTVAGWGDYFRWVGAAAASVIVWEWVERIEALEREERKDGILGREVYDGDEMLEATPSLEVTWPRNMHHTYNSGSDDKDGGNGAGGGLASGINSHGFSNIAHRLSRSRAHTNPDQHDRFPLGRTHSQPTTAQRRPDFGQHAQALTPPPAVASPVSRTDTTSADSTVYTIRYHPISESPPMPRRPPSPRRQPVENGQQQDLASRSSTSDVGLEKEDEEEGATTRSRWHWQGVPNPFRRRRASPPPEVQRGRVIEPLGMDNVPTNIPPHNYSKWALKARLGAFAAEQGEKFREKTNGRQVEVDLPVTIIPPQPRGRTWSPEILQQQSQVTSETGVASTFAPSRLVPDNNDNGLGRAIPADSLNSTADQDAATYGSDENDGRQNLGASGQNTRIRFTPETWQKPAARQADGEHSRISHPLSAVTSLDVGQPPEMPMSSSVGSTSGTASGNT